MNIAKNFWISTNKTSNLSFDTLCKLTLEVCELSEFPNGTFTSNGNRWVKLAKAWDELLAGGSFGIFLDVVHRVMWGFPYCWGNPRYEEIVRIVGYEMIREREAFKAWDTYSEFEDAIHVPANEGTPWLDDIPAYSCSVHHYEYLATRMLYKLRFSKRKYRKEREACEEAWGEYHRCIGKIIPASSEWTEEQWADEANVHNEIVRLYGVDYRKDMDSYYELYRMLTLNSSNRLQRLLSESWYSSHVKELPYSLAKVIWPEDTDKTITQMFIVAASGAERSRTSLGIRWDDGSTEGLFTYKPLRESWVYRWVNEAYSNLKGDSEELNDMKRMLFNVAIYA